MNSGKECCFNRTGRFHVNTDNFTIEDLELFVESLEILSKIERKRQMLKKSVKYENVQNGYLNATENEKVFSKAAGKSEESKHLDETEIILKDLILEDAQNDSDECYSSTFASSNQNTPQKYQEEISKQPKLPMIDIFDTSISSNESGVCDISKSVTLQAPDIFNSNAKIGVFYPQQLNTLTFKRRSCLLKRQCSVKNNDTHNLENQSSVKLLACRSLSEMDFINEYDIKENGRRDYRVMKNYHPHKTYVDNNDDDDDDDNLKRVKTLKRYFSFSKTKSKSTINYSTLAKSSISNQAFLTKALSFLNLVNN